MTEKERIIDYLDMIIVPGSSVAAHGVTFRNGFGNSDVLIKTAENICKTGLNIKPSGGSNIALTCSFMGDSESYNRDKLLDYFYSNIAISDDDKYTTVVVAIPNVLVDSNGREFFLGNFPKKLEKEDQRYAEFPINRFFMDKKSIPKEFIVGYISGNVFVEKEEDSEYSFVPNSDYIGLKSPNEQALYVDSIKQELLQYGVREITPEIIDEVDPWTRFGYPKSIYFAQAQEYAENKYKGYIR